MTLEELAQTLTPEQRDDYHAQVDRLVWIEYNLLDPHNLPRSLAERIENLIGETA